MPTHFHNKIFKILNKSCPVCCFRIKSWHQPRWLLNTRGRISSSTQLRKITSDIWIIRHRLPKTCGRLGKIWKSLPNIRNRMQNSWHIWHCLPNTVDIRHWWQNSWRTEPWLPHIRHIWNRFHNIGYNLCTISIIIWPINPINNMPISRCHASITNLRPPLNSAHSFRLSSCWLPCNRLRRNRQPVPEQSLKPLDQKNQWNRPAKKLVLPQEYATTAKISYQDQ